MLFDFLFLAFLAFLSYCLYIVVILPYQNVKRHEAKKLDEWLKALTESKPDNDR